MKSVLIILMLWCSAAMAQWQPLSPGQEPLLGTPMNYAAPGANPRFFWVVNEGSGSVLFDVSGNGTNATNDPVNYPAWVPSSRGTCLEFDGADDEMDFTTSGDSYTALTFLCWINVAAGEGCAPIRMNVTDFYVALSTNDKMYVRHADLSDGNSEPDGITMKDGEWHQIGVLWDGAQVYGVCDGVKFDPEVATGTIAVGGTGNLGVAGAYRHNGLLDCISFYDRALSAHEIMALYLDPYAPFQPSFTLQMLGATLQGAPSGNPWYYYLNQ